MISYHPLINGKDRQYAWGFIVAKTFDIARISRGVSKFVWSPCIFKDGHRHQSCFLAAHWVALDFDNGEMTLKEATKLFCDMAHIIGTTRSHQAQKHGIICDRFRVVLKLTNPIEDLRTYRHTTALIQARYPCDPAPKDGARFFYPCREIVQIGDQGGYTEDPVAAPERDVEAERARAYFRKAQYNRLGILPGWLNRFLTAGRLCKVGRNQTVFAAAVELAKFGKSEAEIFSLIDRSPFNREGFTDVELTSTIRNGVRRSHEGE